MVPLFFATFFQCYPQVAVCLFTMLQFRDFHVMHVKLVCIVSTVAASQTMQNIHFQKGKFYPHRLMCLQTETG